MRVLLLTDSFLPHAGGSRIYYYNLFRGLSAYPDVAVNVLTKKVPGWQEFDNKSSTPTFVVQRRFEPLPNLRYSQLPKGIFPVSEALARTFQSSADIVFSGDLYPQGLAALLIKKLFGIPYVAFAHGEEITSMERLRFQWRFCHFIYRHADAVIANGSFAADRLVAMNVEPKRICKITPGIDPEAFKPLPRSRELSARHGCAGKFVIMTISRLVPRKGHAAVLKAISLLSSGVRSSIRYLIVGKGPEEERLRQLSNSLGLDSIVEFVGFVPDSQLNAYYNLCDAFVMPNREQQDGDIEGFGMVFIEANAAGKPVIAGNSGGTKEAVVHNQTGFLVEPDNFEKLAETLLLLVQNPELCVRIGDAGRNRAVQQFNWRDRTQVLHELTMQLVSSIGVS